MYYIEINKENRVIGAYSQEPTQEYKTNRGNTFITIDENDINISVISDYKLVDGILVLEPPLVSIEELRIIRNEKLLATDWVSGGDVPQTIKDAWYSYRQALRDLPSTYTPTTIENIEWPTKPE